MYIQRLLLLHNNFSPFCDLLHARRVSLLFSFPLPVINRYSPNHRQQTRFRPALAPSCLPSSPSVRPHPPPHQDGGWGDHQERGGAGRGAQLHNHKLCAAGSPRFCSVCCCWLPVHVATLSQSQPLFCSPSLPLSSSSAADNTAAAATHTFGRGNRGLAPFPKHKTHPAPISGPAGLMAKTQEQTHTHKSKHPSSTPAADGPRPTTREKPGATTPRERKGSS